MRGSVMFLSGAAALGLGFMSAIVAIFMNMDSNGAGAVPGMAAMLLIPLGVVLMGTSLIEGAAALWRRRRKPKNGAS